MGPDYPPQRGLVLMLLGLGVFFLIAALLSFLCWLVVGVWQPYIQQIALIAFAASIPGAYLVWTVYEGIRRR